MAKLVGIRQQRVQFFYDTLFRAVGVTAAAADTLLAQRRLFAAATPGQLERTNLQVAGILASDQTFLTYAIRHEVFFRGGITAAVDYSLRGSTDAVFRNFCRSLLFQFNVGDKTEFEGPATITVEGGGPWGFVFDSAQPLLNLGVPSNDAIYVLPLPIAVAQRQPIAVNEVMGPWTLAAGVAFNVVDDVNNYTGAKMCRAYIDGFHTRDVQ